MSIYFKIERLNKNAGFMFYNQYLQFFLQKWATKPFRFSNETNRRTEDLIILIGVKLKASIKK